MSRPARKPASMQTSAGPAEAEGPSLEILAATDLAADATLEQSDLSADPFASPPARRSKSTSLAPRALRTLRAERPDLARLRARWETGRAVFAGKIGEREFAKAVADLFFLEGDVRQAFGKDDGMHRAIERERRRLDLPEIRAAFVTWWDEPEETKLRAFFLLLVIRTATTGNYTAALEYNDTPAHVEALRRELVIHVYQITQATLALADCLGVTSADWVAFWGEACDDDEDELLGAEQIAAGTEA